ncbi:DUF202 domain-containing protein [Samsonia erythrinae]|uniref:Uncharacterized protein DUF202 n=1 Tax=Samsonia erythrinae TaxID=160434 RepID=A0A4R3VL40_9GAMM|nr:DUF202 domain-containing protein [Samsonia erythrinae]TCV06983.1 uncharacterized protein DUF202 [Samsonia erythrinae]
MDTRRDPGLQPQRTGMAWTRTLFVMLINSLLCFHLSMVDNSRTVFACAILLLCVSVLMSLQAMRRHHFNAHDRQVLSGANCGLIALVSSSIVITALVLLLHFSGIWRE